MESVHLVKCHQVYIHFQKIDIKEVEATVQMHSPVTKFRCIFNITARKPPTPYARPFRRKDFDGKQLEQCLKAIESTGPVSVFNHYSAAVNFQMIRLFRKSRLKKNMPFF